MYVWARKSARQVEVATPLSDRGIRRFVNGQTDEGADASQATQPPIQDWRFHLASLSHDTYGRYLLLYFMHFNFTIRQSPLTVATRCAF